MALSRGVRFTANDIWDMPEDGKRYEVVNGELYVTPPPLEAHQKASTNLVGYIWQYAHHRGLGTVYSAPFGVVLDEENGVQPDIVYVSRQRQGFIVERGLEGAPDLVAEVLSPSTQTRDRGVKMRRYAAAGIPHYWIVDPRGRALEAYRLTEQGYELTGTFGPGSTFHPELFPGLEVPIDDLWA